MKLETVINFIIMKIPSWVLIRKIGENHTIRTAGVWAILVPVTAKLLEKIEDEIQIQILSHEFSIHLALPFSWKILFLVALAFMLANIFYSIFCPSIIKETQYYRDYADQRRSGDELDELLKWIVKNDLIKQEKVQAWDNWLISRKSANIDGMKYGASADSDLYSLDNEAKVFPEIYTVVINAISRTHFLIRLLVLFLYAAGFFGIGIIMIQNTEFVIRNW